MTKHVSDNASAATTKRVAAVSLLSVMSGLADWGWGKAYAVTVAILFPFNVVGCFLFKNRFEPDSVAHVGEMRHLFSHLVETLNRHGVKATYFAVGSNRHWCHSDIHLPHLANPVVAAVRDTVVFWRHLVRHEIVHLHCMIGLSPYLQELVLLKLMGRRVIAHFRGCEARHRERNMALHPDINICQDCDYAPAYLCMSRQGRRRRWVARKFADRILVTTPDLRDFWPEAVHIPFLVPSVGDDMPKAPRWSGRKEDAVRIVHVTNQPGIEGTAAIRSAIDDLRERGWTIEFVYVCDRPHQEVLRELARADLAVGKLKMGYYANVQVESMVMGVPTITWVREDLRGDELKDSGLIFSTADELADVIGNLLTHPEELRKAGHRVLATSERLHGEDIVVRKLAEAYDLSKSPAI
jgi:hypothetical protein